MTASSTPSMRRLLYVEDEVIVALDVAEALAQDLGFAVDVAHNLSAARSLIAQGHYDCALLDMNLGHGERSTVLIPELDAAGTEVVFASGYNRDEVEDIGDRTLVEKPFTMTEIRAVFADGPDPS